MAAPYLIIGCGGDSGAGIGKFGLNDGTDLAGSRIFTFRNTWTGAGEFTGTPTINAADEPLDHKGMGSGTLASGTGLVGQDLALCRLLRDRGKLPAGYDILYVPGAWAGTAFANFWATTPAYVPGTNDGGRRALTPFIEALQYAMGLHASNRIWFFTWHHGPNDLLTQQQYTDNMVATWGEIRSTVDTASRAPILCTGIPPDHMDPLLGNDTTHHDGVVAAHEAIAANIDGAIHIDLTGLKSDPTNDYVHLHAAARRGGLDNSALGDPVPVTNPLSERMYTALYGGTPRFRCAGPWVTP